MSSCVFVLFENVKVIKSVVMIDIIIFFWI